MHGGRDAHAEHAEHVGVSHLMQRGELVEHHPRCRGAVVHAGEVGVTFDENQRLEKALWYFITTRS